MALLNLTDSIREQFVNNGSEEPTASDFFNIGGKSKNEEHKVNEEYAHQVANYVVQTFENLVQSAEFQEVQEHLHTLTHLPQIKHSQLDLGSNLGVGGFSDILEIKRVNIPNVDDDSNDSSSGSSSSTDIQPDDAVVKVLRRNVENDINLFAICAAGLAKEGAILGSLSHENIVQMRGLSETGLSAYATGRSDAFFIVLDRLHDILDDCLVNWAHKNRRLKYSIRRRKQIQYQEFFRQRLLYAADLAAALAYLHNNNIIHRDIKPGNVGFDAKGTLKMFDFDVSRVLPKEAQDGALFNLTQATGTQRYMSPECGLTGVYNLKSDVYSFAILFHEMLSLERPFQSIRNPPQHNHVVFRSGLRPRIHNSWPESIKTMMTEAWSADISSRPSMGAIRETILQEAGKLKQPASE